MVVTKKKTAALRKKHVPAKRVKKLQAKREAEEKPVILPPRFKDFKRISPSTSSAVNAPCSFSILKPGINQQFQCRISAKIAEEVGIKKGDKLRVYVDEKGKQILFHPHKDGDTTVNLPNKSCTSYSFRLRLTRLPLPLTKDKKSNVEAKVEVVHKNVPIPLCVVDIPDNVFVKEEQVNGKV